MGMRFEVGWEAISSGSHSLKDSSLYCCDKNVLSAGLHELYIFLTEIKNDWFLVEIIFGSMQ